MITLAQEKAESGRLDIVRQRNRQLDLLNQGELCWGSGSEPGSGRNCLRISEHEAAYQIIRKGGRWPCKQAVPRSLGGLQKAGRAGVVVHAIWAVGRELGRTNLAGHSIVTWQ